MIVESCFERANDFIPERWYKHPEMVKNKNAFAPFALGTSFNSTFNACPDILVASANSCRSLLLHRKESRIL